MGARSLTGLFGYGVSSFFCCADAPQVLRDRRRDRRAPAVPPAETPAGCGAAHEEAASRPRRRLPSRRTAPGRGWASRLPFAPSLASRSLVSARCSRRLAVPAPIAACVIHVSRGARAPRPYPWCVCIIRYVLDECVLSDMFYECVLSDIFIIACFTTHTGEGRPRTTRLSRSS